jgi:Domain of unknown function (DUF4249)
MKRTIYILIAFVFLFFSCERVVNIDLNDVTPAIVIEGRIYEDSLAWVEIHLTTSYFHPDTQFCICDAVVSIKEDDNVPDTLLYKGGGFYESAGLTGKVGSTYYLKVEYQNTIYEAQSELHARPLIYSLTPISFGDFSGFGDSTGIDFGDDEGGEGLLDSLPFLLFVNLYDDPSVDNYYLFNYYINGDPRTGSYIVGNDENADNDTLSFSPGPTVLVDLFDTVTVRVNTIDRSTYTYFDQLSDALRSNSFFSSTPYNPLSNISNGALGYFTAMSYDSKTTIILPVIPGMP